MYRVNEIFYSLQGEGRHTGRPAVFIRFSGCNLRCPFCDTDFTAHTQMTVADIMNAIKPWSDCGFVVLTGGEPSLQVDDALVDELHRAGFYVAVETNGTHALPGNIDWVTWSPKEQFNNHVPPLALSKIDEIKVVFDGKHNPECYSSMIEEAYLCLQPCDTGNPEQNQEITKLCVDYILHHPHWHLSLQTHKIIHIQ